MPSTSTAFGPTASAPFIRRARRAPWIIVSGLPHRTGKRILRILDILGTQLADGRRWLAKTTGAEPPSVRDAALSTRSSLGDQDSPWEVSSDSEPEPEQQLLGSKNQATIGPRARQLLEASELAVKCLYILPLRKPAPMDRLQDRFIENREVSPFAEFDLGYIQDKFPGLASEVQKRLAKMITRRRQLLVYRQQHNDRLVKGKESDTEDTDDDDSESQGDGSDDDGKDDAPDKSKPPPHQRIGPATQYTKATTVRINQDTPVNVEEELARLHVAAVAPVDDDTRTSVAGSRATREIHLEAPPRPKQADGSLATLFQCKYCYLAVQVSGEREWREHVLSDLQPYVCTYTDCHLNNYLFDSVDAWFGHESQTHRVELFCHTPGHLPVRDHAQFREHLRKEHNTDIGRSAEDIDVFQRPIVSPYGECNLCPAKTSNIKRHLSRHLRQIALFAIPRADYSTGDDAGDESTQAMHYSAATTSASSDAESSSASGATSVELPEAELLDEGLSEVPMETLPNTRDSYWETILRYGVQDARDGRSEAPPATLPKFAKPEPRPAEREMPRGGRNVYINGTATLPCWLRSESLIYDSAAIACDGLIKRDVFCKLNTIYPREQRGDIATCLYFIAFPNPRAKLTIDGKQEETTETREKTLNPYWNEKFLL
ncbi:hypothetical protein B0T14DRAFT_83896 [Immersiella caudata]|uniref:C2 domain-containing protein n=1 Tax=Immersiella caudata TaxID=314043 RepID=A0AA40CCZ7_9PEZI|nr:hypothetical protein B0T14DRAFT_83896 [Immersiella caudata]